MKSGHESSWTHWPVAAHKLSAYTCSKGRRKESTTQEKWRTKGRESRIGSQSQANECSNSGEPPNISTWLKFACPANQHQRSTIKRKKPINLYTPCDKCVVTYRPPTDHLPITYQPLTNHLPTTYPPLTHHLPTTYRPLTNHLPTTYRPPTDHLPTTYRPPTDHLPTTYWPLTDHLPTTYRPLTDHLPTTYRPLTDHLPTTYPPPTDHLPTTCWLPADHLPTDHLPTTYPPLTDHLPTTYPPPTHHLPTTYRPLFLWCSLFMITHVWYCNHKILLFLTVKNKQAFDAWPAFPAQFMWSQHYYLCKGLWAFYLNYPQINGVRKSCCMDTVRCSS